jgi:hypothetical protein
MPNPNPTGTLSATTGPEAVRGCDRALSELFTNRGQLHCKRRSKSAAPGR